jgi:hypothetical protein
MKFIIHLPVSNPPSEMPITMNGKSHKHPVERIRSYEEEYDAFDVQVFCLDANTQDNRNIIRGIY